MKTYSVCIKVKKPTGQYWVTNWHKMANLEDIDFEDVKEHCIKTNAVAYGYMFGCDSNSLTSSNNRTILETFEGYDSDINGLFINGEWIK